MHITKHFTIEEATTTETGIPNSLTIEASHTIYHTANKMEMVRALLGNLPIKINSWYRSEEVNKAVGGSKKSQHIHGEAVDFTCEAYGTPYQVCQKLSQHKQTLGIDQLIYEGTWVHVSFVIPPRVPRLEVLTCMLDKSYQNGLILKRSK
jgi:hypothetical protein